MPQNPRLGPIGGCAIGVDANADLLLAAMEGSRVPSLLTDPDQVGNPVVHASPAFGELTGYAEDELLGRDFATLLQGVGDSEALARLDAAIAGRAAIELEIEVRRKDGTRLPVALFLSPVHGADGHLRYFFCALFDIASRAKLRELHAMARSVGHEFNNLLTIIRTNLDPLRQVATDAQTEKRLDRVALGVDRATALVRTFLAKVRGGAPPVTSALPRARGGETILLVEPDEVLCQQAGSMLRGLGYQVEAVVDADAALHWLGGAGRVDLMLARSEDGLALAKPARAIVKDLRILYSTESPAPQRDDSVARPFQLIALGRAIRVAIDGAGELSR